MVGPSSLQAKECDSLGKGLFDFFQYSCVPKEPVTFQHFVTSHFLRRENKGEEERRGGGGDGVRQVA